MKFDVPFGCMGLEMQHVKMPTVAGIDVRPGSYDVIIADLVHSNLYDRKVLRPVFIGKVKDERESLFVMLNYGVRTCVIDARPETTLAKRLQTEAERHFVAAFRAQYNTQPSAVEWTFNETEKLYTLERTMTLDNVQHLFQSQQQVALPRNFRDITSRQFVNEMTASTRTPTRWHGRDYWAWVERGADHSFHAFNMLLFAANISGLFTGSGEADGTISVGTVVSANTNDPDPDDPDFRRKHWKREMDEAEAIVFEA